MNERITLVSLFDEDSTNRIKKVISITNEKVCKVSFGKNISDRYINDTLPLHFTISAWDIKNENLVISKLKMIKFPKTKIEIDGIEIMNGKENSYVLYFSIKENAELKKILEDIYSVVPSEKYNPKSFIFHITIHIDKDYNKILDMKNILEKNLDNMKLIVDKFGLFEIYPAKLIEKF